MEIRLWEVEIFFQKLGYRVGRNISRVVRVWNDWITEKCQVHRRGSFVVQRTRDHEGFLLTKRH